MNPIDLLSLALLVFTAVLSYRSYKFQLRASVRETLTQFDDREVAPTGSQQPFKVKAVLHGFEYGPSHIFVTWIDRIRPLLTNNATGGQGRSRWTGRISTWVNNRLDGATAEVEILFRFYQFGEHPSAANKGGRPTESMSDLELQDVPDVIENEGDVTDVSVEDNGLLVRYSAIDSPSVGRIVVKTFDSIDETVEG